MNSHMCCGLENEQTPTTFRVLISIFYVFLIFLFSLNFGDGRCLYALYTLIFLNNFHKHRFGCYRDTVTTEMFSISANFYATDKCVIGPSTNLVSKIM